MALITVKQFMGQDGGFRDVLISTEHVVSIIPTANMPGYHEIHLVPTQAGMAFVTVAASDAKKVESAINN